MGRAHHTGMCGRPPVRDGVPDVPRCTNPLRFRRGRCPHRPAGATAHPAAGHMGPALQSRHGKPFAGGGVPDVPYSAAAPRCKAPSARGLSAKPTGGEKSVRNLSPRQRFALPPPSQREARGIRPLPSRFVLQLRAEMTSAYLSMSDAPFHVMKPPVHPASRRARTSSPSSAAP